MGRVKNFKKADVLDKAIQLFWKQGYAKTSLSDLEHATGVNKSGLYSEFEDKNDLFTQSLEWYSKGCGVMGVLLKEPLGEKNIETFLLVTKPANQGSNDLLGCFVVNSIRDYAILPDSAKSLIESHNSNLHMAIVKNLKVYIKGKDLSALANLILTFKSGMALGLNMGEVSKLKKQVSYFLKGLKV